MTNKEKNKEKKLIQEMFSEKQMKAPFLEFTIYEHFIGISQNTYLQMLEHFSLDGVCDKFNKEQFPSFMWWDRGQTRDGYIGNNSNFIEFSKFLAYLFYQYDIVDSIDKTDVYSIFIDGVTATSNYQNTFSIEFDYMLITNDEDINYAIIRTGEKDNILRMFKFKSAGVGVPIFPFGWQLEAEYELEEIVNDEREYGIWLIDYKYSDGEIIGKQKEYLGLEELKTYYTFYKQTHKHSEAHRLFTEFRISLKNDYNDK